MINSIDYTPTDIGLDLFHNRQAIGQIIYLPEDRRYEVNLYPKYLGDNPSDDGTQFISLEAAKYYALAMYIELTTAHILREARG